MSRDLKERARNFFAPYFEKQKEWAFLVLILHIMKDKKLTASQVLNGINAAEREGVIKVLEGEIVTMP